MRCKFSKLNNCRLMAAIIAVVMMAALFVPYVSASDSGSCGSGVKWELSDGVLTISGKGAMSDYADSIPAPWSAFMNDIRVVNVGSGVTHIGNFAFYTYPNLKSVTLSDSVTSIGKFAFADCVKLSMVSLGSGLRSIGKSSFNDCESLQSIRLPMGLATIEKQAFYSCGSLRSISIPVTVTSMGVMCFAYCNSMVSATVNAAIGRLPELTFYGCKALSDVTLNATITSVDSKAFQNCDSLQTMYYLGSPAAGVTVDSDVRDDLDDASQLTLKFSDNTSGQSTSTVTIPNSDGSITVETVTVKQSDNAMVATRVPEESASSGTTVKVDAVIENDRGWSEVVDQIQQAAEDASKESKPISNVQVSINCNNDSLISGDTLSDLSGKNVNMTVNMNDGSVVKIDCKRLEDNKISGKYDMSYSVSKNLQPTEAQTQILGESDSYVLSFTGDTELDFSPQIYVGENRTHSCATLYQVESDGALTEVQSSIVDKDGNATFYLKSAYKNSEYVVAIDVLGVDRSSAIIPEDLKVDYGITDEFEQIVQYIPTVERKFLGMNIAQFSFAMFGTLALLVVGFGVVMGVFYRKKRLEMFYRLKMQEELEQEE